MKMKAKLFILFLMSIFVTTSSLAADTEKKMSDADILGVVVTLDKNEIAAAKIIVKQNINADVKHFAGLMVNDHSKNLHEVMGLAKTIGKPATSKDSLMLKASGLKELVSLKATLEKNLAKTYIDDMVRDHADALKCIDEDLIPNATNAKLKAMLVMTRAHVAGHLEKAKALQAKM